MAVKRCPPIHVRPDECAASSASKGRQRLNHPNLLTIHEIARFSNAPAICTSSSPNTLTGEHYASGWPLAMPLDVALDVRCKRRGPGRGARGRPLSPRLKPENLMLRRDGYVKLLDFGLVKLMRKRRGGRERGRKGDKSNPLSPLLPLPLLNPSFTEPGMVMGTAVTCRPNRPRANGGCAHGSLQSRRGAL